MKRTREEANSQVVRKVEEASSTGAAGEPRRDRESTSENGNTRNSGGGSDSNAADGTTVDTDAVASASSSDERLPSSKKAATATKVTGRAEAGEDKDSRASAASSSSSSSSRVAATSSVGPAASGGAAGGGSLGGGRVDAPPEVEGIPNETLFVGNLSYRVSEAVIIKLFTPFGKVVREQFCYHMVGPRRGEPRGFCFVEYSNCEDAAKAIRALHGRKLYGRPLRVRFMAAEGKGRMDYSTSDNKNATGSSGGLIASGIPPPAGAGGDAGAGAGVTRLALDKKVALLKLKLREAQQQSGKR